MADELIAADLMTAAEAIGKIRRIFAPLTELQDSLADLASLAQARDEIHAAKLNAEREANSVKAERDAAIAAAAEAKANAGDVLAVASAEADSIIVAAKTKAEGILDQALADAAKAELVSRETLRQLGADIDEARDELAKISAECDSAANDLVTTRSAIAELRAKLGA